MDIMVYAGIIAAGVVAGLVILRASRAPFRQELAREALRAQAAAPARKEEAKEGPFRRASHRIAALFPATTANKAQWRTRLAQAGAGDDADLWHGAAIVAAVLAAAALGTLALALDLGFSTAVVAGAAGALVGWMAPRAVLSSRIKKRRKALFVSLPNAIELLRITTAANQSIERGFKEVADNAEDIGAIAEEFGVVYREVQLSGADFTQALMNMSERCQVPEVSSFCSAMAQARKQGSSISGVLKSQAEMARNVYFDSVKTKINKIAVWIAIPLGAFFLPCAFALFAAPMASDIMAFLGSL